MRTYLGAASSLILLAGCAAGGAPNVPAPTRAPADTVNTTTMNQDYLAQLPPLIDRELFFGDPRIASAQLSPDGQYVAFRKPYENVMNVWVKGIDEPFDAARPLTDDERPVPGYFWSEDGQYILYVQDKGGDENFHVYAVDPSAAGAGVPSARDLTPIEGIRAQIYATPDETPNQIIVGINERDPQLHDVYRLDLETGERELLIENTANIVGWTVDDDGDVRLGLRVDPQTGDTEILTVENLEIDPEPVYTCDVLETCVPIRMHPDGQRVYMITNQGDRDLTELILFDPATGEETLVERDPEGQADFGGALFSEQTGELLATSYIGDRVRIYPKDDEFAADLEYLEANLPEGDIYPGGMTANERLMLVTVTRDVDPGSVYLFDRETDEIEKLYESRPELPTEDLATMRAIRYTARDGLEIPAYLTLPEGVEPRNLPAIILPHGGPWARDVYGYNSLAQFLANRGYAVLQPNFRGSTGYGKAFLNAGNDEWGTGAMQHDLTDAVRWLIDEGIADPERVGIMGGSYGGYATLAGLAFTPDLYAAGVDIVGPSNIITLLESIPPYWAPLKTMFDIRVGDPADPEDRARLEAQSPLNSAEQISAPLLVIQGANDPRVKQHESDQIVVALRERGFPVQYIVAPDEGHGFRVEENSLAMWAAAEEFLAEHLGGRYQEEVPPEIGARLAEITVDVDTVTLASAADDAELTELEFSGAEIQPMTLQYQQRLSMGSQEMEIASTHTVAEGTLEGNEVWIVTESAQSPMGAAVDSVYLDARTLRPLRRAIQQGPATIELLYGADRVTGAIQAGPQNLPIDAALEGTVAVEGGPLALALSSVELAEGMTAAVQIFDATQGRAIEQRIRVSGTEVVTVPAGEFAAFRIEIEPADGSAGGSTIWIEQAAPHRLVKTTAQLPAQMGGGTATAELVEAEM